MIVEYIRYAAGERAPDVISAYERAEESLAGSPHCLGWDVTRCLDEPGSVIVRMHWDSVEGDRKSVV